MEYHPFDQATPTEIERIVQCHRHGDRSEAFVCRHLLNGEGLGFFSGRCRAE